MRRKNIEIKARCKDFPKVRALLEQLGADFRGVDTQIDTYFVVKKGILKLREASLPYEKGLIHYKRTSKQKPKLSEITVYQATDNDILKKILTESLETEAVIKKQRELFTLDNVKFHLDTLPRLGTFVEIEAQDTHGLLDNLTLLKQCKYYMKELGIEESDLISESYRELGEKSSRKNK